MKRFVSVLALGGVVSLAGCVAPTPKPNDPYYAPVLPRTPLPAAANNGSIYQAGFEQNLYSDRKAFRVGDIITITLNERTQASKNANSQMDKNSDNKIGLTSLFGSSLTTNNPIGSNDLSLNAGYSADRSTKGDAKSGQSNSLTGSITVTVADVLPNGIIAVRGEKWLTLNTGDELVRIAGLVRADDIATDNTVSSTRVADARITYSGTGAFADTSQPGWFDRFFLSPLFPF
ncbi:MULTISPECIES: flagellar basal body L-ring protein FlgH [Pseudomonas]|jgi:flagellar L-ring protein precursor FlgH|uniref:Flagellar L-ring protein n=2 Tax=Pseudomonas fluorescens group TaxID=136843 RepID=A0A5E7HDM9_PSEFL|nr:MULTISPECIES: flagellar basal body L-ring protein FlgH [Pseudomonas]KPG95283.1 flagellar basal body L-ring protein [Pseudomonas sp. RIT-PI-r]MCF5702970.1 flagellar basal body L-ring protein FlgH [Pseudomonas syringae]MCP1489650.1 flagellar L-ring protein precursor FlgH [Pseudomonas fluorescens]MDR9863985.1 flagellar basal body L-ring protein FlgH [Pseudomonas baetica]PKA67753.1 flagellar L-ring protein precursor FlgH [Pseudomonas baetica]